MKMKKVNIPRDKHNKSHFNLPYQEDFCELKKIIEEEYKQLSDLSAADYMKDPSYFEQAYQSHRKVQKILNRMTFFHLHQEKRGGSVSKNELEPIMNISFSEEINDVLIFQMNELLPHKMLLDVSSGKMKYVYDRAELAARYRVDLDNFLDSKAKILFPEPLFVWFDNIIPFGHTIDADNLDVKVFIDTCVNKVFVNDDNISHIHYGLTGRYENVEESYTVAYVGPEKNVIKLMIQTMNKWENI